MNLLKIIYLNVFHQTAEAASFGVVQILTAYAYVRTIDFSTWWKDQIFLFFGFKEAQWRRRLILRIRQCFFYGLFIATDCEDGCSRKLLMQK